MNKLSTEKRKVIQISLTEESMRIIETFTKKYGTSKSIVIERALQFLAANYHRKIYLQYVLLDEDNTITTTTEPKSIYEKTKERHEERINKIIDEQDLSDEEIEAWVAKHKKIG